MKDIGCMFLKQGFSEVLNANNLEMKRNSVSVVLCTYERAEMLSGALSSLLCQETAGKFEYEVLVIDNGSKDNTKSVVDSFLNSSPVPVRYILEERRGTSHARNRGVRESTAEWIAFCDDDQLADPNWLKELMEVACENGVLCVGGRVNLALSEDERSKISLVCRRILGETPHWRKFGKCGRKKYPGSGNVLMHRIIFDVVGVFDETFNRCGEDWDFFTRVRTAGFEAWYTPRAIVKHIVPSRRLSEQYFKSISIRIGGTFAAVDYKQWGFLKTVLACIARVGQALLINLPFLLFSHATGNQTEALGRKCLLWRAGGYAYQTYTILMQQSFLKGISGIHLSPDKKWKSSGIN